MKCKNCGTELPEEAKFCFACGQPVTAAGTGTEPEPILEAEPGDWAEPGAEQTRLSEPDAPPDEPPDMPPDMSDIPPDIPDAPEETKEKRRISRVIAIGVGVLAVAVVVVALLALHFGDGSSNALAPYVKSGMLYQADLSHPSRDPLVYEDAVLASGAGEEGATGFSVTPSMVQYSPDEQYIAFPANITEDGYFRLYTGKTDGKEAPVKLGNTVRNYRLLDDGRILWLDDDGTLYLATQKGEKERVGRDVYSYFVDAAQKNVIWTEYDQETARYGAMYAQALSMKEGRVRLARGFDYYLYSTDRNYFAFLSGTDLYYSKNLGESERIARNVTELGAVLDSGAVYYSKALETTLTLYDLIEDDTLADDATMTEPDRSAFYNTSGEFDEAGYQSAVERYAAASDRADEREQLRGISLASMAWALYRYDGRKEVLVEAAASGISRSNSSIAYTAYTMDPAQVTMGAYYQALQLTGNRMESASAASCRRYYYDPEGKTGFYRALGEDGYTLYRYPLGQGTESATLLSDELTNVVAVLDDNIYYYVEDRGGTGALYQNDQLISTAADEGHWSVSRNGVYFFTDFAPDRNAGLLNFYDGTSTTEVEVDVSEDFMKITEDGAWFVTDFNGERQNFTLNFFNRKSTLEIGGDVRAYLALSPERVALLTDYSAIRGEGELDWYNGKKVQLLDDEVVQIIGGVGY